jgi:hypothetical protein
MAFESIIKFKTIRKQNTALLSCTRTNGAARRDGSVPGILSIRLSEELLGKMGCSLDTRFDVLLDIENRQGKLKVNEGGFKMATYKKETAPKVGFINFTMPESLAYIPKDTAKHELNIASIGEGWVIFYLPTFDSQSAEVNQMVW